MTPHPRARSPGSSPITRIFATCSADLAWKIAQNVNICQEFWQVRRNAATLQRPRPAFDTRPSGSENDMRHVAFFQPFRQVTAVLEICNSCIRDMPKLSLVRSQPRLYLRLETQRQQEENGHGHHNDSQQCRQHQRLTYDPVRACLGRHSLEQGTPHARRPVQVERS